MYHAQPTKPRPKSGVDQAFSAVLVLRSTSSSESSFSLCRHACEPNNGLSCDEACLCLYHDPMNVPTLMKKARPLPHHVEIVLALLMKSTRPLPPRVEIVLVVMLKQSSVASLICYHYWCTAMLHLSASTSTIESLSDSCSYSDFCL